MADMFDTPEWKAISEAINKACDELEDVPGAQDGEGWSGEIYGFCPVQGEGEVDKYFWYFRARDEAWRFEVYTEDPRKVQGLPPASSRVWAAEADYDGDASWMPWSEAWKIIKASIATGRSTGWAMPNRSDSGGAP